MLHMCSLVFFHKPYTHTALTYLKPPIWVPDMTPWWVVEDRPKEDHDSICSYGILNTSNTWFIWCHLIMSGCSPTKLSGRLAPNWLGSLGWFAVNFCWNSGDHIVLSSIASLTLSLQAILYSTCTMSDQRCQPWWNMNPCGKGIHTGHNWRKLKICVIYFLKWSAFVSSLGPWIVTHAYTSPVHQICVILTQCKYADACLSKSVDNHPFCLAMSRRKQCKSWWLVG